jgi:transposase
MLSIPAGIRIWLVAGFTDMRRGLDGLSALVQTQLSANVLSGELFIFRGRRSDRVKIIWRDPDGLCLLYKRLDRAKFTWTHASDGAVLLTPAQLSALLEGIDWVRRETDARQRVKVLYGEGLASHTGPESCGDVREGAFEALTGVRIGRVIERRKTSTSECQCYPVNRR